MAQDGIPFNPADLEGRPIPERPQITISLERKEGEDVLWLTQCVDPLFDMNIVAEALATQICIAADYQQVKHEIVLKQVVDILKNIVKFRGTIRRSSETS